MTDKQKKKKEYEPPLIKEIGGVYEQAMGASSCATGGVFSAGPCRGGLNPSGGCPGGPIDQGCLAGATDAGGCSRGVGG